MLASEAVKVRMFCQAPTGRLPPSGAAPLPADPAALLLLSSISMGLMLQEYVWTMFGCVRLPLIAASISAMRSFLSGPCMDEAGTTITLTAAGLPSQIAASTKIRKLQNTLKRPTSCTDTLPKRPQQSNRPKEQVIQVSSTAAY